MNYSSLQALTSTIVPFGIKLIAAIAIWIIGNWIMKFIIKQLNKIMSKKHTDESLRPFIISVSNVSLKILIAITALSVLGIEMTSFIAILGAAGLAVGMALSGTLQNFAGGVMILLFKPFKVGDLIETSSHLGIVHEIQVFNTTLKSFDNKTHIIPNGGLSTNALTNYSTEEKRRVDWTFGIGYGDDAAKAKAVIQKLCEQDSRIINEPAKPFIALSELGDSSVNFVVRAWVKSADYWDVFFDMNENVYNTFAKEGINIPFPQMDVHLHNK